MPMYRKGGISPWQPALLGLLLTGLGVAVPAVMLPPALADGRAYAAAAPCPGGTAAVDPAADCLLTRQAAVTGKDVTGRGDNKKYFLVLGFPDGTRQRAQLGKNSQQKFETGEPVTVVSWRHEIREITTRDGERLTTRAHPAGGYIAPMMVAVLATPVGGSLLWMAHWLRRLRRTGRSPASVGRRHTSVPFVTAVLYGFAAMIAVALSPSAPAAAAGAGGVAVGAVLLGALAWRRQRNKAGPKAAGLLAATGVRVPVAETVIPARVSGEVPYSRTDCDHLVLSPAGVAVTSDGRGRGLRIPLPGSLAFVRLHRGDAVGRIDGVARPLLVECRDGDREVLIAADRGHVPWILGALWPRLPGAAPAVPPGS
ncbi:hypothetical protein [Streptomyces aidingensis]|uniref:Uncharacterized protein n=1 Tax=Streptomyces aidingensis TaxID=910347 RepID=A0A1I1EMB9_9ACTN|nr:hypothetical protein [Streptomyces aidingensis]SFB88167.1 hypothetical protein SAMN05421773_101370 [Streptomyces aidingensis]